MLTPFVVLVAASVVLPTAAVPRLHVEPSCRAVSSLDLAGGQSFSECMKDEAEARKELAGKWNGYPAASRSRCSAEVTIGGDPSYVELLECLEMNKFSRTGVAPDRVDQSQPPSKTGGTDVRP